jgi:hypothetical protein
MLATKLHINLEKQMNLRNIQKEILEQPFDCLKGNVDKDVIEEVKVEVEVEELDRAFLRKIS